MVKIIFFTKTKKLKNNKDQKQNFPNFYRNKKQKTKGAEQKIVLRNSFLPHSQIWYPFFLIPLKLRSILQN